MVPDIEAFVSAMAEHQVPCTAVHEERWGLLVDIIPYRVGVLLAYTSPYTSVQPAPKDCHLTMRCACRRAVSVTALAVRRSSLRSQEPRQILGASYLKR